MVRLILTLISGTQVMVDVPPASAAEVRTAVTRAWSSPAAGITDVNIAGDGGADDWVRVEHISAVRIETITEDGPDATSG